MDHVDHTCCWHLNYIMVELWSYSERSGGPRVQVAGPVVVVVLFSSAFPY